MLEPAQLLPSIQRITLHNTNNDQRLTLYNTAAVGSKINCISKSISKAGLCCALCGTRWHLAPLQWTFAALRRSDNAGSSLAMSFIVS